MENGTYNTLKEISTGEFKNKGSKFFAYAHPVTSQEEIKALVKHYRKKYYDARHHCYAYILGENDEFQRAADDGEPSNSAGNPILNQIKSAKLSNTFVMVVRYFGGTKLGVPGLIEAYGSSAQDALTNAIVINCYYKKKLAIACAFSEINNVMKVVKDFGLNILGEAYTNQMEYQLEVKKIDYDTVCELLADFIKED